MGDKEVDREVGISIPSLADQEEFVRKMEAFERIKGVVESVDRPLEKSPTMRRFTDGWKSPTPNQIKKAFEGYTGSQIRDMLGLSDARVVRRWIGGDREISYAHWRLFLIESGRVV